MFHPSMFHHQINKSCCGEKVLVTNLSIARNTHDMKAKKCSVCPSKCCTMTLAAELSHTDCTCLYLALNLIAKLCCMHIVLIP